MPPKTKTLKVPKAPAEESEGARAIQLRPFLQRLLPYYSNPSWLEANRWRQFVRNQPVAISCRETLISNMLNKEWDIVPKNPDDAGMKEIKKAVDYYKELFTYLEGDFDTYLELMLQDMLDLPFGAAAEVGRWNDEAGMPVVWAEHIDGASLFPTANRDYPVAQYVPEAPTRQVIFEKHQIARMYMSPRPEIRLKGWGMAPPQKIYLAIEMMFRGDHYYWKLLLDTPEAGILDLIDMEEQAARDWLTGFRDLFQGIDGFKIPVLYGHQNAAQWIPLNRPPIELQYDKTYIRYAQLTAAGYGVRLSDIGLSDVDGGKTLAGVIREERQSRRTGQATVKAKSENHFNSMLPDELKFIWKDQDEEQAMSRGRAMVSITQGLKQAKDAGMIDQAEARAELVASGMLATNLDPKKIPEKPKPPALPFGMGQQPPPNQQDQGKNGGGPVPADQEDVPPDQGGRGNQGVSLERRAKPEDNPAIQTPEQIIERMNAIIHPGLMQIERNAEDIRLRRLIKAATREMFEDVASVLRSLDDEQVQDYWLPEMQKLTFDQPSDLESYLVRRSVEEAKEALEAHLNDDTWWSLADILDKQLIVSFFVEAYEMGLEEMALEIIRALYEEGLRSTPSFGLGINFNLTNRAVLELLEFSAADLVTNVDSGTKYFLKRMITAGVRQGLSSPTIAAAIRDGQRAAQILEREDYIDSVADIIREGLIEMSEYRSNSIVNTEIARAENAGRFAQVKRSGLKEKRWRHLGPRGITEAGNPHPCPVCEGNELLGFVPIDFVFETVFKSGGVDGKGGELHPPAHPSVCHCDIKINEQELFEKVSTGEYTPWTGD